jgi:hypothetical protein
MNSIKIGSTVKPDNLLSDLFGDIVGEVINIGASPFSSRKSVTVKWEYGGTIQASPDSFILVNQPSISSSYS